MLNVTLNESKVVQNALNGNYNEKNIMVILNLLLKYYYINGMTDKLQLREQLLNFLKNSYIGYKRAKWEDTIYKMTIRFLKVIKENKIDVKLIDINEIKITENELELISKLNDIKLEKVAFIMLVYAKISNIMIESNEGWINKTCSVICKESKVNLKGSDKEKIFNKLYIEKYIEQRLNNSKTNMKVCYIDEKSEPEIVITNFDNVVYYYVLWKNKDMVRCGVCGKPIKVTNNKTKYCKACAKEILQEQKNKWKRENWNKEEK